MPSCFFASGGPDCRKSERNRAPWIVCGSSSVHFYEYSATSPCYNTEKCTDVSLYKMTHRVKNTKRGTFIIISFQRHPEEQTALRMFEVHDSDPVILPSHLTDTEATAYESTTNTMTSEDGVEYRREQWRQLQRERARSVQLHLFLLSHAAKCKDDRCPSSNCAGMKTLVHHERSCQIKQRGGCASCKRLWALVHIHARQCRNPDSCHVPHCRQVGDSYRRIQQGEQQQETASPPPPVCGYVKI